MSMLAETRKKVKYSVNPRGTSWSNDEDKFGQKLMEKFGWQKGKGLGANEDGRVEHVKASGKNNTKGFGFKKTDSNNWICHQDDFNSLLSELNASHGRSDQHYEEKVISLEEKSKAAKKRVHYHKHAKGKDLSQRSSEDLDCIFGRKKSKIPKEEKEVLQDVEETKAASATEETTHGIQTVQSNQSVQEYFAMKMAKMKAKKYSAGQQPCLSDGLQKEEMEPDQSAEVLASKETSPADPKAVVGNEEKKENPDEKSKKKKKKKSKEKKKEKEREEEDDCSRSPLGLEEKGKTDRFYSNEADNNVGENCDDNLSLKKTKSKRKKRSKECITDVIEADETLQNVMEEEIPIAEEVKMTAGEINFINKPSKKKRDKKSKVEISLPNAAADSKILENSSFSTNTELIDITFGTISKEMMVSIDVGIAENETTTKPKKSKKNKRMKEEVEAIDNVIMENEILDKSVTFDMKNNSGSNVGNLVDNNDEETIASPPKKKKKRKSSKKSKSEEADEFQDAQTADGSMSDEMKVHVEITDSAETEKLERSSDSASAGLSYLDDFNSSVTNSPRVPENKSDIKRSQYAVNTATEIFQKAGANVDTICGYGYTME